VEITEVRIKLMEDPQERLQAFCSITFDHCFVIRDLKIIEGAKGSFVAMPSRKLTDRCPRCGTKNNLRALHCNQCGVKLLEDRAGKATDGRAKLYADIAHPINSRCREMIQSRVMDAFREEQVKAKQPGYICAYDDYGEESYADLSEFEVAAPPPIQERPLAPVAATPSATPSIGNGVHRIESGNGAPPAPHLPSVAEPTPVVARSWSGNEEGFGEGIV
jgi:stage V sporulation protein G